MQQEDGIFVPPKRFQSVIVIHIYTLYNEFHMHEAYCISFQITGTDNYFMTKDISQ